MKYINLFLIALISCGNLTHASPNEPVLRSKLTDRSGRTQFLFGGYDLGWGELVAILPGLWTPQKIFFQIPRVGLASPIGTFALSFRWLIDPMLKPGEQIVDVEFRADELSSLRTRLEDQEYSIDLTKRPLHRSEVVPRSPELLPNSLVPHADKDQFFIGLTQDSKGNKSAYVLSKNVVYAVDLQRPGSPLPAGIIAVQPGDLLLSVAVEHQRIFEVYVLDPSSGAIFRLHGQIPGARREVSWVKSPRYLLGEPSQEEVCRLLMNPLGRQGR